jgi:hypothetical protein
MSLGFTVVKVYANKINKTNINVKAGQKVLVECDSVDRWMDFGIKCDANGWDNIVYKAAAKLKDIPEEKFMKMIAQVGSKKYPIGMEREFVAEEDGDLVLFANDVCWLRWNNAGSIDATIRIK